MLIFFQIQVNLLKKEGKNKFEMEQFHVTGSNGQILSTGGGQVLMQAMPDQVVLQSGQTIQTQGGQVILHMSIYIYNLSCITSLTWYYFLSTLNFYIICYFLIFSDILYFSCLCSVLLSSVAKIPGKKQRSVDGFCGFGDKPLARQWLWPYTYVQTPLEITVYTGYL